MKAKNNTLTDVLLLGIVLCAYYFLFLGGHALVNPDEGRYSSVALGMLRSHHYLSPAINGVPFWDKPILFYALQMLSIKWLGLSVPTLRVFPALLGVASSISVYLAGRWLYSRRAGVLAAVVLATMPLFFALSHYANMDVEVASWLNLSLLSFIVGIRQEQDGYRRVFLYLAYAFAAFAFLTKGMIGLVFPIMIIGIWVFITGQWHTLKKMCLPTGLLLFVVITAPWFVWMGLHHPGFLQYFFVNQQVDRFLGTSFNEHQPMWYYVQLLFEGAFPWSVFALPALWQALKLVRKDTQLFSTDLFLLVWFLVILTFFSLPMSKLPGYIGPACAPLALLLGVYIDRMWNQPHAWGVQFGVWLFTVLAVVLVVIGITHMGLLQHTHPHVVKYAKGIMVAMPVAALFALLNIYTKRNLLGVFSVFLLFFLGLTFVLRMLLPHLGLNTIGPMVSKFMPIANQKNVKVVAFESYFESLPIHVHKPIYVVAHWNDTKTVMAHDNWRKKFYIGLKHNDAAAQYYITPAKFWSMWQKDKVLVFVDQYGMAAFKASHKTFKIIAHYRNRYALVNS